MLTASCEACDWVGTEADFLKADNPFNEFDGLIGCPECKAINSMVMFCQVLGCCALITCGTPTDNGYVKCCSMHYDGIVKDSQ